MISSFADDPLRRTLRQLHTLLPFAPRGVAEALSRFPAEGLLAPILLEVQALRRRAEAWEAARPSETSCLFPAVSQGSPVQGAVFHALASPIRPYAACPIEDAFPEEGEMRWLLRSVGPASLSLLPNPLLSSIPLLSLEGGSAGGAFAAAAAASRRGASIPGDVAISAAVHQGPDGSLHLRAVSSLEEKVRILELERPGCRFFFVAPQGERLPTSTCIQLFPLEEGPLDLLLEAILPAAARTTRRRELFHLVQEAERAFQDQDYPTAKGRWSGLLGSLTPLQLRGDDPKRWRHQALARLGAIELHAGRTNEAESLFRQAADHASGSDLLEEDDLRLHVAGVHIDRMCPGEAASILLPLTDGWRSRMAADPVGADRRRILVACLGGLRRLHLLLGEADVAVEVQTELLGWSGEQELARSLGDLGECLRRAREPTRAQEALRRGREALEAIYLPTQLRQTEAFLAFHEGRLHLDLGEPVDLQRLAHLEGHLPERSAARWRLVQLRRLVALRSGERAALEALMRSVQEAPTPFSRWHATLGLLRGALVAPEFAWALHEQAAKSLQEMASYPKGYPRLERALLQYLGGQEQRATAALLLLELSAY